MVCGGEARRNKGRTDWCRCRHLWCSVKTLFSGISSAEPSASSGRERLPNRNGSGCGRQCRPGNFPFPVKYGYSAVGEVLSGAEELIGRQRVRAAPASGFLLCTGDSRDRTASDDMPSQTRNAHGQHGNSAECRLGWRRRAGRSSRDCRAPGLLACWLRPWFARGLPEPRCSWPSSSISRPSVRPLVRACSVPAYVQRRMQAIRLLEADVVFSHERQRSRPHNRHRCLRFRGDTLIEMSWFGDRAVSLQLGGAFHAKRIRLISSQVGHVSAGRRRTRWSHRRRLEAAIRLLADDRLDVLVAKTVLVHGIDRANGRYPRRSCRRAAAGGRVRIPWCEARHLKNERLPTSCMLSKSAKRS